MPQEGIFWRASSSQNAHGAATLILPDGTLWSTALWFSDAIYGKITYANGPIHGTVAPFGKVSGNYILDGNIGPQTNLTLTLIRQGQASPDPFFIGNELIGTEEYLTTYPTKMDLPAGVYESARKSFDPSTITIKEDGTFSVHETSISDSTKSCNYAGTFKDTEYQYKTITYKFSGPNCALADGTTIPSGVPMEGVLFTARYVINGVTFNSFLLVGKDVSAPRHGITRMYNR